MIIKLMLTVLLGGILVYALTEYRRSHIVAGLSMAAATVGIYLTWNTAHASLLAGWVGVGRGVDLIVYIWVVISLLMILNLHLKLRMLLELITVLARTLAIERAQGEPPREPAPVTRLPRRA